MQITLKIKANEGSDILASFETDNQINNVSTILGGNTTENDGVNGKSFANGFLSLSSGFVGGADTQLQSEINKYNGFMFGATDSNGEYDLLLTLKGTNIDKIILLGDKRANQFPTELVLDEGTEFEKIMYSDDPSIAVAFLNESDTHTIRVAKWNRANYNACFTVLKIFVEYIEILKGQIDRLESNSQSTTNASEIQYGIIANSGSAMVRDIDGELKDYIEDGVIDNSNVNVELFINGKQVQTHITTDSIYEEKSQDFNIQLSNKMKIWDTMTYNGFEMIKNVSAYEILYDVLGVVNGLGYTNEEIDEMLSNKIIYDGLNISTTIKSYLNNLSIPFGYLKQDTFTNTINKICNLAQLQCFIKENGKPAFVCARPIAFSSEINNALHITDTYKATDLEKSIMLKNKYDVINFRINNTIENINEDLLLNTIDNNISEDSITYMYKSVKSAGAKAVYGNIMKLESFYSKGTTTIPKRSDNGLKEITSLNISGSPDEDGYYTLSKRDNNVTYTTKYRKAILKFLNESQALRDILDYSGDHTQAIYSTFAMAEPYSNVGLKAQYQGDITSSRIPTTFTSKVGSSPVSINIADNSYIKVKDMGEYFDIKYNIISSMKYYDLWLNGSASTPYFYENTEMFINTAESVTLSFYGNNIEIAFEEENKQFFKNGKIRNISTDIGGNELIQYDNNILNSNLVENTIDNIFFDYDKGVKNGNVKLFVGNFYNSQGIKIIDFKQGEIVKVHDIIYFENDLLPNGEQRYWRVVGRNFTFDGQPLVDLELQEIMNIYDDSEGDIDLVVEKSVSYEDELDVWFQNDINYIEFKVKFTINGEERTTEYYKLNAVEDDFGDEVQFENILIDAVGLYKLKFTNMNETNIIVNNIYYHYIV